jgi:hypothetical protein
MTKLTRLEIKNNNKLSHFEASTFDDAFDQMVGTFHI